MCGERISEILEDLFQDAMKHKPLPTYPKIGTIKAIVDLGEGWHDYREIQRELGKVHKTGNVYSLYLARRYPEMMEVDVEKRVRIRPEAFPIVKKAIRNYAKQLLQSK